MGLFGASLFRENFTLRSNVEAKDDMNYYEDMGKELTYEFNRLLDANPATLMPAYQRVYAKLGNVQKYRAELDAMKLDDPALQATRKKYLDSAFEVYYAASKEASPATAEALDLGRQRLIERGFLAPMPVAALPVPELYPAPQPINAAKASKDEVATFLAQKWLHREANWTGSEQWVKDMEARLQ
jgi:hypothetical protein